MYSNRPSQFSLAAYRLGFDTPLVPHSYQTVLYLTMPILPKLRYTIILYTPVFRGPAVSHNASPWPITSQVTQLQTGVSEYKQEEIRETISARYLKNPAIIGKLHDGAGRYEAGGNGPKLVREEGELYGNDELHGEERLHGEWEVHWERARHWGREREPHGRELHRERKLPGEEELHGPEDSLLQGERELHGVGEL